jgi:hypothetical protein
VLERFYEDGGRPLTRSHGTITLCAAFAAFDVLGGKVIGQRPLRHGSSN